MTLTNMNRITEKAEITFQIMHAFQPAWEGTVPEQAAGVPAVSLVAFLLWEKPPGAAAS